MDEFRNLDLPIFQPLFHPHEFFLADLPADPQIHQAFEFCFNFGVLMFKHRRLLSVVIFLGVMGALNPTHHVFVITFVLDGELLQRGDDLRFHIVLAHPDFLLRRILTVGDDIRPLAEASTGVFFLRSFCRTHTASHGAGQQASKHIVLSGVA